MDRIDPTDPIERIEPAEPIDRIEPVEPIDSADPTDPMLRQLATDQREPADIRPTRLAASFTSRLPP